MGGAQYAGSVQGSTTTTLPQKGRLDPGSLAKSAGVGALDHGFTPAGRAAVAVAMHRREQEQTQTPSPVPDTMALTMTTHLPSRHGEDRLDLVVYKDKLAVTLLTSRA